jgi:hypothetical protein
MKDMRIHDDLLVALPCAEIRTIPSLTAAESRMLPGVDVLLENMTLLKSKFDGFSSVALLDIIMAQPDYNVATRDKARKDLFLEQ